jgi:hypothetical protein
VSDHADNGVEHRVVERETEAERQAKAVRTQMPFLNRLVVWGRDDNFRDHLVHSFEDLSDEMTGETSALRQCALCRTTSLEHQE